MNSLNQTNKQMLRDGLFFAAWSIFLLGRLLSLTEWCVLATTQTFPLVLHYMDYLASGLALLVILINFIRRVYSWKVILLYGLFAAVIALSAYFAESKTLIPVFLIFGAAYQQSGKKIITISAIIVAAVLFVVVVCSQIGLTQNVTWFRPKGDKLLVRESLGFIYASTGASIYLGFLLQYCFLRKERTRIWEFAILELVNVFFYLKTDSRMPFYFGTAILLFFLVESLFRNHWRVTKHLKGLFAAAPWILCILSVLGSFLYNSENSLLNTIDRYLSNRLVLGNSAISTYGIKPFGQPVMWIGYGSGNAEGAYNYVDCSYVQILVQYGILLLLAIIILYTIGMIRTTKQKDFWLACILGFICVYSVTEPNLFNLAVIPLPLLMVASLGETAVVYEKGWLKHMFFAPSEAQTVMKKPASVKKNFIMNAVLTISTFVFPLISFPYVSRILLSAGTGRVSFAQSVIEYFLMFSALGIPTYGIRACARVRDDKEKLSKTAQELLLLNIIMCVVSYALLAIAILVIPKFRAEKTLLIIISATILFSAIGMEWLFKALEQYTYITLRSIVFNAIGIICMFILVHKQSDYLIYAAIGVTSSSLGYILNLIHARKYIILKPLGNYDIKRHLKPVMIFFAMACATTVYTNLDKVMLGFMRTNTDVGYYHAAIKIKAILVALVTSLGTVLLPRVSYYVQNGQMEEFKRVTKKAINFVFVFAVPVLIYFILYAKNGVLLLSGPDFLGAVQPMQILMPTVLFIGLTGLLGIQILVPLGKEKYVLYSEIAGAVVDLILNAILIPKLGASGAAIGTLVAEGVVLTVQIIALRNDNIKDAFRPVQYWKIVIAAAAGCAACFWVPVLHQGNFITLLISAVLLFGVYAGVLLLLKEPMAKEIWSIIMRILKGESQGEIHE